MKIRSLLLVGAAIGALTANTATFAAEAITIYGVTAPVGDPFMISTQCGAQDAAKKHGVAFNWQGAAQFDANQELAVLNTVIQQKPNGLVLMALSPTAFLAPVKELMAAGVPVVNVGPSLAEAADYHNVNSNNQQGGEIMADHIGESLGGEGAVAVLGLAPGNNPESPRDTALIDRLKAKFPKIRVLPEEFVFANSAKAAEITTALINANPDLKAVFGSDGPTTMGILSGIKASGKQVKAFGYDTQPPELQALQRGELEALVAASPYNMGFAAVEKIVERLKAGPSGAVTPTDPHTTITPVMLITKDNLDKPETAPYIFKTECK